MEDGNVDEVITRLSNDLLCLALEVEYEEWKNQDAQDWYIAGLRDSAHLTMLNWINDDIKENQDGTEAST